MSDFRASRPKGTLEILPPQTREDYMPLSPPLSGVSIINRARYWAASRELRGYIEALQLRNSAMEQIIRGDDLNLEFHGRTRTRVQHLQVLRQIEARKINLEMDKVEAEAEALQGRRDDLRVDRLDRELRETRLKIELANASRDLDRATKPPAEQSAASRGKQVALEIARIREDFREIREALAAAAGGPDQFTERDKEELEQAELAERNAISALLETIQ